MKSKMSPRQKSVHSAEKRLHKTCDQMEKLQGRISQLQARKQRTRNMAAAESLGLQLSVLEGMYAMYYTYAETQCEQMMTALSTPHLAAE